MKKSDFKDGKPFKKEIIKGKGQKVDPYKELKRAYSKPTRVAEVGGKGFV
jgi:hypothetical protein